MVIAPRDLRSWSSHKFDGWYKKTLRIMKPTVAIWRTEALHDPQENHAVTCTNCTVTVKARLPRCDMCPKNTKQHLLKRFAKLKRRASVGHSWSHVTPDLIRSAPWDMKQNAPRQRPEELSFLVLCSPRTSTRLGGNCCTVSWRGIKVLWCGKKRVRRGKQRPSQHGHKSCN